MKVSSRRRAGKWIPHEEKPGWTPIHVLILVSFLVAAGLWARFLFLRYRRLRDAASAEPFPTCPRGHSLRLFMATEGACDGCGAQVQSGGQAVLDCRTCDWFVCQTCLPQAAAARCPKGHELIPSVPGAGVCDGCGTAMGLQDTVLDCRKCDWFICQNCLPSGSPGSASGFAAEQPEGAELAGAAPARGDGLEGAGQLQDGAGLEEEALLAKEEPEIPDEEAADVAAAATGETPADDV